MSGRALPYPRVSITFQCQSSSILFLAMIWHRENVANEASVVQAPVVH